MSVNRKVNLHEKWRELILAHEKSGLTQNEFCRQYGIGKSSFSQYKTLLKSTLPQVNQFPEKSKEPQLFSPVKITQRDTAKQSEVKIILPNGFQCIIPSHLDGCDLKRLMGVLLSC